LREIILSEGNKCKNGIIFCNRKIDVDILMKSMKSHGFNVGAIHGDLEQSTRMEVLNGFKDESIRFLIASDVAARGLDIPNVSHVFNFDVPIHSEDYVHRIGRTGRAGRPGSAIMISTPTDSKSLSAIERLIKMQVPEITFNSQSSTPSATSKNKKEGNTKNKKAESKVEPENIKYPKDKKLHKKVEKLKETNTSTNKGSDEPNKVIGLGDHTPAFLEINFRD
jgi:ATP-dependent RNA helicase RhlE